MRRCRSCEGADGPEEAARRSREVDREPQPGDGPGETRGVGRGQERAASENEDGPLGSLEEDRRRPDASRLGRRGRDGLGVAGNGAVRAREDRVEVAAQVPLRRRLDEPLRLARLPAIPAPDERLVVEEVDRALDEDGAGDSRPGDGERPLERGDEVPHLRDRRRPLDDRLHEGELVDVLEGPPATQDRRRRATEEDERRRREPGVLQRRDRVRHPRPGRHRGDAGHAGEPGDGVGREDGRRLVPGVDDADSARLRRREDRRDVPAAEGEEEPHAVPDEDLGDQLSPRRHRRLPERGTLRDLFIRAPATEISSGRGGRRRSRSCEKRTRIPLCRRLSESFVLGSRSDRCPLRKTASPT